MVSGTAVREELDGAVSVTAPLAPAAPSGGRDHGPSPRSPRVPVVEEAGTAEVDELDALSSPDDDPKAKETRRRQLVRLRTQSGIGAVVGVVRQRQVLAERENAVLGLIRETFRSIDVDGNGQLGKEEFALMLKLCSKRKDLRMKLEEQNLEEQFRGLDEGNTGQISYQAFEGWFINALKGSYRFARQYAQQLFHHLDTDRSDSLTKPELGMLFEALSNRFPHLVLTPPFELDRDFQEMADSLANSSVSNAVSSPGPDTETGRRGSVVDVFSEDVGSGAKSAVCWDAFEWWWRLRTGDNTGTVPVLPESMVARLDELSSGTGRSLVSCMDGIIKGKKLDGSSYFPENAHQRWLFLAPRLRLLAQMSDQLWGQLSDLYPGSRSAGSLSLDDQLIEHQFMRHPNSTFVKVTDMISIFAILYTVVVVPLRIGFNSFPESHSWAFWFDVAIDLVFCVDIILNFRTARITQYGTIQENPKELAKTYLKGWFFPDFFSAIPFSLIASLFSSDTNSGHSVALKAIRLTRLMKMMRATRIVAVLSRFENFDEWRLRMSSFLTFLTIAYSSHLLTCIWFYLGDNDADGWVQRYLTTSTPQCPECPGISIGNKYSHAMYTLFKMGDGYAVSAAEKTFAILSEGCYIVIQGALAGLMSQLMMSSKVGENEYLIKLAKLKSWMTSHRFAPIRQKRIMKHFIAKNQSATHYDEKEVLGYLPEALSRDLSLELYKPVLGRSPLFRFMTKEITLELCAAIIPVTTVAGHVIFKRGDVGHEMYFVMDGEVEVTAGENCELLGYLSRGGFFGEKTVIESVARCYGLGNATRNRTIRAKRITTLGMLRAEDILRLCAHYPELEIRMKSLSKCGYYASAGVADAASEVMNQHHRGPTQKWSCNTLHDWLCQAGASDVAEAALKEGVDGSLALEMDSSMWRELGAKGLMPARIARDLKRLSQL